jgi:glucan phosphorylase
MRKKHSILLGWSEALRQAGQEDLFSHNKIKYAISENISRIQSAMETYNVQLNELLEEHDEVRREELLSPDSPEEFKEGFNDLLDTEAEFDPYYVPQSYLEAETSDVPFEFIDRLRWMFKREEQIG